jgi:hypothetical protein
MANYAVIENNQIRNVIVADSLEIAQTVTGVLCIEISTNSDAPKIGWYYIDGEFSEFAPQEIEPVVQETDPSIPLTE